MQLEGKTLAVTGAAAGIGRAVVAAATRAGANVLALDIDDEGGRSIAAETGAHYMRCDVGSVDAWRSVAEFVADEFARLDFLHLNAGIQIAPPDADLAEYQFENLTIERYRRLNAVNVDGVVFGLHALLPFMDQGSAVVVTSSLAGVVPYDIDPLYAMTKHAVAGLVRSLGKPLAQRGIHINALCPGGIDTAIIPHQQRTDDAVFMTPENVANEVLFLLDVEETGKTWAKVRNDKPLFIIRAPGDRGAEN